MSLTIILIVVSVGKRSQYELMTVAAHELKSNSLCDRLQPRIAFCRILMIRIVQRRYANLYQHDTTTRPLACNKALFRCGTAPSQHTPPYIYIGQPQRSSSKLTLTPRAGSDSFIFLPHSQAGLEQD
jgi:hypothetical protein